MNSLVDEIRSSKVPLFKHPTSVGLAQSFKAFLRLEADGVHGEMPVLFVAGTGRSGTTAFANYLNQHPEIMILKERYKFIPREVTPKHFTFERILDYSEDETNLPREHSLKLLSTKDPEKLKWIGDKVPRYVRHLKTLQRNNPGARFIIIYRPVEEVAESYEARSRNPKDPWLGNRDGFKTGVRDWNVAMRKTRDFIESRLKPEVLVVSYHDFFYRNETFVPLISRFLDLEFDDSVRESWRQMSLRFEERRRPKNPTSEEQRAYIEENKDQAAEAWILERIERQWREPELLFGEKRGPVGGDDIQGTP